MLEGLLARTRRPERRAELEAELAIPALPLALVPTWDAFQRLSSRRGSNGFGINPIAWSEIDAFVRLSGQRLAPWQVGLIEMLDDLYRREHARKD